ncbi:MAG: Npt1/Npt2 family nucleotide transporter [Clostridia bacterium]|nr:Npt1/Npt2 family nucleotide transporter [Clostridia bacterium]
MSEPAQNSVKEPEFNKLQQLFWPIHNHELKKFLPMSLLMFCILFVYTMVRDLKDVFIQKYAVCGGTELIPVLKLWFVMPAAFLTVMLFTYLVGKFGNTKTFYIMVSIFAAFFATFVFVLFPNHTVIHANAETVKNLQNSLPGFFYFMVPCVTNWSFTLFYIFSEIWGTIAISSLFWQFANRVTRKSEVKRFYGVYALLGNMGVFVSGTTLEKMSKAKGAEFDRNVVIMVSVCILFALATMGIFYYINNVVLKDPRFYDPNDVKPKKKKGKVGMMEGIKILFTSPYIGLVAVLVVSYGIAINFIEVVLKEQMRISFPDANQYGSMMGKLSQATAIFTFFATLLSTNILRKCKWIVPAIVSPLMMLIGGGAFFSLVIYSKNGGTSIFGVPILIAMCWLGIITDALIKSVKYCLFDSSKNLAYRPLDEDEKTKGQAAVEVIGGRAGKAGASAINYLLTNIVAVGSKISAHLYTIIPIFAVTVIGWTMAVFGLNKQYTEKIAKVESEEK